MTAQFWPIISRARLFGASVLVIATLFFSSQQAQAQSPFTQQGPKLVGSGAIGQSEQGASSSVAVS
jgi:hypothetical protein